VVETDKPPIAHHYRPYLTALLILVVVVELLQELLLLAALELHLHQVLADQELS
jgi:hypothetical protein